MAKLIPAILESDVHAILSKTQMLQQHKDLFYRIQLDVVDGVFTKGKTVEDPNLIPDLNIDTEVHLMVMHPDVILRSWIKHPSIKRLIIHIETVGNVQEVIDRVRAGGKEISLACNPDTPFQALEPYMDKIDGVLLLSVTPGKQGQPMQTDVIEKLKEIKKRFPKTSVAIDGGVNAETIGRVLRAGGDDVIVGGAIWSQDNPELALRQFHQILSEQASS